MGLDGIRSALVAARNKKAALNVQELDRLVLSAGGGLVANEAERAELLRLADSFAPAIKARLQQHLAAAAQPARVSIIPNGQIEGAKGRYARVYGEIEGLTMKVGLFDNTLSLRGTAQDDAPLVVRFAGEEVVVDVLHGERPPEILEKLRAALPPGLTGHVFGGEAQLYEPEDFNGFLPTKREKAAHLAVYRPEALGLRPGEKPLRVVVTGYGPFGAIKNNPSDLMAQKLAALGVTGAIIDYRRLDVTHGAVDDFVREMVSNPPDVILSMGVGSVAQVEERPENRKGAGVDGKQRSIKPGAIRKNAPNELASDLPLRAINQALDSRYGSNRQVGSSASNSSYSPDRSAYLCNYLGYKLADAFGKSEATTAGFVHILEETPPEQMHTLLEAVVSRQLELRRLPTS